jgi:hypothetical protein
MAHIVTPTFLLDSPSKAIVHVYIESDGQSGDLSNFVLIDPKLDFVDSPQIVQMSLAQVWYSFGWFDGFLSFDDVNPYPSWQLSRDSASYFDFRYFGGIKDRSSIDTTGKLLLSTNGLTTAGSRGTMVIELKKNKQT